MDLQGKQGSLHALKRFRHAAEAMFCARCEIELERFSRPVEGGLRSVEAGMCVDCGGLWIPAEGRPAQTRTSPSGPDLQ
jgi:hypothetical protein